MILVTGSAGHLGEALMRLLAGRGLAARGVDLEPSPFTDMVANWRSRSCSCSESAAFFRSR